MRYLKIAGLTTIAVVALMGVAGAAWATSVTSPKGTAYTSTFKAVTEGHTLFTGPLGIKIECNSTIEANIESHGSEVTASGKVTSFTLSFCTNNIYPIGVSKFGTLEIHTDEASGDGTVTWTGAEWTVKTPFGFNCIYSTSNTDIGTLTGSRNTGGTATLDIKGNVPRTGHSALCGPTGEWSASYKIVTPDYLDVD
jgi:hypothetical protein